MYETTKLQVIKKEILERVKLAAQNGDIGTISFLGKAAEQCEKLIIEATDLEKRIKVFVDSIHQDVEIKKKPNSNITTARLSNKKAGGVMRNEWVTNVKLKGVRLNGHGKKFQALDGKSVGVASANEINQPHLLNKWFLGLKDEPTDIIVLLCRDTEKVIIDIVIPVSELGAAWEALSRSGGQIKFNVRRQQESIKLLVPGNKKPVDVTKYVGNYQPLLG